MTTACFCLVCRVVAIPADSEGTYSSCEAFNLSYSNYTLTDFYYWNRSASVTDDVVACTDWVYDQSQYVTTISSEVRSGSRSRLKILKKMIMVN